MSYLRRCTTGTAKCWTMHRTVGCGVTQPPRYYLRIQNGGIPTDSLVGCRKEHGMYLHEQPRYRIMPSPDSFRANGVGARYPCTCALSAIAREKETAATAFEPRTRNLRASDLYCGFACRQGFGRGSCFGTIRLQIH